MLLGVTQLRLLKLVVPVALAVVTHSSAMGSELEPSPSAAVWGVLGNGFRYAIIPSKVEPGRVRMSISVMTGFLHEGSGEIEAAHLVEHMLAGYYTASSGARVSVLQHPAISIAQKNGGATTGAYQTRYWITASSGDLNAALGFMRGISGEAKFSSSEFEIQKKVVGNESLMGPPLDGDLGLQAIANPRINLPPVGTSEFKRQSLARMPLQTAQSYYDRWYVPKNQVLTIVGDVDPKRLESDIIDRFSSLPSRPDPELNQKISEDFAYIHYRAKYNIYSRIYLQLGVGDTVGVDYDHVVADYLKVDAVRCLAAELSFRDGERGYFASQVGAVHSFRVASSGVEISLTALPRNMPQALNRAGRAIEKCERDLLASGGGESVANAALAVAGDPASFLSDSVRDAIIFSTSQYDSPLARDALGIGPDVYARDEAGPRAQAISRLFSLKNLRIAAYDPIAGSSILADEAKIREAVSHPENSRINLGSVEPSGSSKYDLGRAIYSIPSVSGALEKKLRIAFEDVAKIDPSAVVNISVRSDRGFLDGNREHLVEALEVSRFFSGTSFDLKYGKKGAKIGSVRINIGGQRSSLSFTFDKIDGRNYQKALDSIRLWSIDSDDFDRFLINGNYGERPVASGLLRNSVYYYFRNGVTPQCDSRRRAARPLPSSDVVSNILREIFTSGISPQGLSDASDVSDAWVMNVPDPLKILGAQDVDLFDGTSIICRGGPSDAVELKLFFSPARPITISEDDRRLGSALMSKQMNARLREGEGVIYSGLANINRSEASLPIVSFELETSRLNSDQAITSLIDEIRRFAAGGGISDHDILVACATVEIKVCDVDPIRSRMTELFRSFHPEKYVLSMLDPDKID